MQSPAEEVPIACNIQDPEQLKSREEEVAALIATASSVEELADGYAFSFESTAEKSTELLNFVLFEKECCPFFTFELLFTPNHGPLILSIRGPEGAKEMFSELKQR